MSSSRRKLKDDNLMPSKQVAVLFAHIITFSKEQRFQFIMPEVVLACLLENAEFQAILVDEGINVDLMKVNLHNYLNSVERVPGGKNVSPIPSKMFDNLFIIARDFADNEFCPAPLLYHYFGALIRLEGSFVQKLLLQTIPKKKLEVIIDRFAAVCIKNDERQSEFFNDLIKNKKMTGWGSSASRRRSSDDEELPFDEDDSYEDEDGATTGDDACRRVDEDPRYLNAPFAGRADEIRRAITTLCKKERGNIVFVGDHGVGKSKMLVGLIQATAKLKKKTRLGSAHFYKLNISALVTGVSYADEVENRITQIIDDIEGEHLVSKPDEIAILFADNLSELMPQTMNDNTPDTLRLLTSLTEGTGVRIVTTASFEQYKRLSSHNATIEKHFCRIDINEPPLDPDGRAMVRAAANDILKYHNVECDDKTLNQIIDTAAGSIRKDIAMPGRAIDLIDNLGAFIEVQRSPKGSKEIKGITQGCIDDLLKMMGYGSIANQSNQEHHLRMLEPNMLSKIFGQDEAVHGVSQSVLLAKAGLSDDTKPLAAYLFVGPTGVGKTELAKVLATELGVKLVRFDMSEYSEQHTVSKLVGSPAGYIGYDDGGHLTDAVRKNPNCVLLFDEIEKAHPAVFNLLLQVLDYAQLTDNKGQKADFSGTIIIMTSNAGARFATGTGLGFGAKNEKSEVMGAELKKTFAPEFLNRLTQVVPFHDMTEDMASRILDRKVSELQGTLAKKKEVTFSLSDAARELILKTGFSARYGAREMDRAIGQLLKPTLMNILLFGGITEGDHLMVERDGDHLTAEKKTDVPKPVKQVDSRKPIKSINRVNTAEH